MNREQPPITTDKGPEGSRSENTVVVELLSHMFKVTYRMRSPYGLPWAFARLTRVGAERTTWWCVPPRVHLSSQLVPTLVSLRERIAAPQRLEGDRLLCRHGDDGRGYYGARSNCLELTLTSTSAPESLRSGL